VFCIFVLLELLEQDFGARKARLLAVEIALIAAFPINIGYLASSRTALIVLPVLLLLFGLRGNWKIAISACVAWAVLFSAAWTSSPYLKRCLEFAASMGANDQTLEAASNRQRLAYQVWQGTT
jgi:O-antigen ligase